VTRRAVLLAAACLCATLACRHGAGPRESAGAAAPVVRELVTPAAPGSLAPSLVATEDGRVLLSWVETRGEGRHALRFATRAKGAAWSDPLTVAEGKGWFVNWADFPHLGALADGTLFAHWLEKRAGGATYDYDVRVTRSRDGGRRWDEPFAPYRDATAGEHGFVAFAPLDPARMGVLFLDGRETKDAGGAMTLRFAAVSRDAPAEPDTRVDERVCDCCQTALVRTTRGLVAAYRDRSASEVRDIAVVRLENGRWSAPAFPGAEGWQIHACPVNGPALAAAGDRVALAWFTMAGDAPRVKLALSEDAGASWGPAQVVDDGQPIGRVDVVLPGGPDGGRGDGSAIVSWLEQTEQGASLRLRRVGGGTAAAASLAVAGTNSARSSGFPRMAVSAGELVVAWRDASEPARLVTAVVEVP
jgi:hypothetical protein